MKKNRTTYVNKENIVRDWYVIDAAGKILGKVASQAAGYLRGKHKPIFAPHVDCGDFVVVINAGRIRVTGRKEKQKTYFTHSGYPAGDKLLTFEAMMARGPEKVVRHAVAGMLPKNRLGAQQIKKLKVYVGSSHPHPVKNLRKLEVS